ncbi:MAG: tryptophan synthase subunit alpha [Kistimonas sp.]|nr:tryptophan synthase subunit alpha [Kistimonas sp.]
MSQSSEPDAPFVSGRIGDCFLRLQKTGRRALIPYITAGDPDIDTTLHLMHDLVAAGADIIELGVPFSDPVADGPIIEQAHQRALARGVTLPDVLNLVKDFRRNDHETPVVLMSYLNPVEIMGYDCFSRMASASGVDALLTVDLPAEDADALLTSLRAQKLEAVFMVAPNTPDERIASICSRGGGYIYAVSFKGITGASRLKTGDVQARVAALKKMTDLPVCSGFGIHDGASAAAVSQVADGVIVGSALVKELAAFQKVDAAREAVSARLAGMRQAMDELAASRRPSAAQEA